MANNNEKPKKAEGKNFFQKFLGFFKRAGLGIVHAFRNMWAELKKVTWPTMPELRNYSLVVLVFMVFMGIIISVIDLGSAALVNWLIS